MFGWLEDQIEAPVGISWNFGSSYSNWLAVAVLGAGNRSFMYFLLQIKTIYLFDVSLYHSVTYVDCKPLLMAVAAQLHL